VCGTASFIIVELGFAFTDGCSAFGDGAS